MRIHKGALDLSREQKITHNMDEYDIFLRVTRTELDVIQDALSFIPFFAEHSGNGIVVIDTPLRQNMSDDIKYFKESESKDTEEIEHH